MTTRTTIFNHGPLAISVGGGSSGSMIEIPPGQHAERYLHDGAPIEVTEVQPQPSGGGGPGEPEK